ncbi:hypothetical protein PV10_00647 [Exophiala mesophila]|uniref:Uncharacterized protein n=1 Tax=Exophiala mesophila TaxID=212818 RepID=A0A0D1X4V5_EXOME|nr:uncharacterized protein PV10_00647 [Exophiala mesophila]KIV96830.1 hypothetical protein PV10_00647 [Exophiala mesophila]
MAAVSTTEKFLCDGAMACLDTLMKVNNIISVTVGRKAYEDGIVALLSSARDDSVISAVHRADYDVALLKLIDDALPGLVGPRVLPPFNENFRMTVVCNMQLLSVSLRDADMALFTEIWHRQLDQLDTATAGGQQPSLLTSALTDDTLNEVTQRALAEAEMRLVDRDDPAAQAGTIDFLQQGALIVQERIKEEEYKLFFDSVVGTPSEPDESMKQDSPHDRPLPHDTHTQEQGPDIHTTRPPPSPSIPSVSEPAQPTVTTTESDPKPSKPPKKPKAPTQPKKSKPLPPLAGPAQLIPGDTLYYCDGCPGKPGILVFTSFVRHFKLVHGLESPEDLARAKHLYPKKFPKKKPVEKKKKSTSEPSGEQEDMPNNRPNDMANTEESNESNR